MQTGWWSRVNKVHTGEFSTEKYVSIQRFDCIFLRSRWRKCGNRYRLGGSLLGHPYSLVETLYRHAAKVVISRIQRATDRLLEYISSHLRSCAVLSTVHFANQMHAWRAHLLLSYALSILSHVQESGRYVLQHFIQCICKQADHGIHVRGQPLAT